ncbi:hypothetical protein BGZ95_006183 [Linnemannia exigua]|uniref:SANT domain-containing protein n=1 Tax=Linnemannia exigua TaxID=604196 RepID=A0AAD4H8D1_9FUNG|nr:hypothetical protein BGZ95_006183 [Linnemannia exigua]
MERSPLLSPLQTASSQLKSSRIHSTVSSPGGIQHMRSSSRSPPPPTKPRSESHDRSYSGQRRRPPRSGAVALSSRNGPDSSPPSELGFQESPRVKYPERFSNSRDARFRSSDSLKGIPIGNDHSGQASSPASSISIVRHFGSSSAPNTSTLSHSRDFSPTSNFKGPFNEPNHNGRSMDYFPGSPSSGMGPGIGLGLGPARYMDREDWRGRPNQFPREFERDRDFRTRDIRQDIRQDIRDLRELRPPRDPRDTRDQRDQRDPRDARDMREMRDGTMRERDAGFGRDADSRERDNRDNRDRDLRELGINTRDLRERDNRDRDTRDRGPWGSESMGRDSHATREGLEDVRELVERERERLERERDRNRERPIWLRESEKDHEPSLPTRPTSFEQSGRDRDRERASNSRAIAVQALDRDLLAYADKARNTPVKSEEPSNGTERLPTKPATPLGPPTPNNSKRDSRQQGGDESYDRDRPRERDRFNSREEDRDDVGRDRIRDWELQRERERSFHYRSDGAGLRSENDPRQDRGNARRQRILSAPMSDEAAYNDMGHQRDQHVNNSNSYPNSPAISLGGPFDRYKRNDRPERRYRDTNDRGNRADSGPMDDRRSSYISQDEAMAVKSEQDDSVNSQLSLSRPKISDTSDTGVTSANHMKRDERSPERRSLENIPTSASSKAHDADPRDNRNQVDKTKVEDGSTQQHAPRPVDTPQDTATASEAKTEDSVNSATHISATLTTKESSDNKLPGSPTASSLPSPGMSPVQVSADVKVPKQAVGFENHADILVEIDRIDGRIQRYEELLEQHREQKKPSAVEDLDIPDEATPVVEEEVPLVVTESEPPVSEEGMDVDVLDATEPVTKAIVEEGAKEEEDAETPVQKVQIVMQDVQGIVDAPSPASVVPDKDMVDFKLEIIDSEDVDMTVESSEAGDDRWGGIVRPFTTQDFQQSVDEDDPFLKRKEQQKRRPQLFDQIYAENNTRAKKYGRVHSAIGSSHQHDDALHHHHHHDKPQIYESVEDYPFYYDNIDSHERLRTAMLRNMSAKATALDEKELQLKRDYKQYWEVWEKKVQKLDKLKEKQLQAPAAANVREEDQVVGENTLFTPRNRRGAHNGDAVRSEAELMEIIQSLENADMRNPDVRASRTAATVPPMILDPTIRDKVRYLDRNHLVTDPATYYRLGPVTDNWTEEERQIFIKRYLIYPKQFGKIAAGIEDKTASQCVLFYYREKKKIGFKELLSNRGRKRKPAAGKRKEKAAQTSSPSGQPGKKHKGSALIEDIGQANRTKLAKSKELRDLQDLSQSWRDEIEPGPRRRVRSNAASQQGGTPGLEESHSNTASPAPSSTVSTPALPAQERRKAKSRTNQTRSAAATAAAAAAESKAPVEETVVEEKKLSKAEKAKAAALAAAAAAAAGEEAAAADEDKDSVMEETVATGDALVEDPLGERKGLDTRGSLPSENGEDNATTILAGTGNASATNAVGTKTVDQCRNFCFNYKRKFGVSVLEDTNNLDTSALLEEGDDKDAPVAVPDKTKGKKGRGSNTATSSAPGTPNSSAGTTKETNSRRKGGKTAPAVAQDPVKEELPKTPTAQAVVPAQITENVEDSETGGSKRRRKRVVSKNDASQTEGGSIQAATSFRALYSRDPPSSPGSPSISGAQSEDGQTTNADGSSRRTYYSSYWSSQEKIDFVRLLSLHGKDWDKIAKAMKTKSLIQVRNHFSTNADKLAADGVIPPERVTVSPMPPHKEEQFADGEYDYQQQQDSAPSDQGRGRSVDYEQPGDDPHHSQPAVPGGPVPGYFMPSANQEAIPEVIHREQPRPASPPRRATNIDNLLNNDDEDVNIAPEDWFGGNSEEGSAPQSQEHSFEAEVPVRQDPRQEYSQERYVVGRGRREDEDVETEDEYDSAHRGQGMYGDNYVPSRDQRRASETNIPAARSGYPSSAPSYYGHSHSSQLAPPPPQQHHHSSNPGVLGSPYGAQPYYTSSSSTSHLGTGYRSPPPPSTGYSSGVSGHGIQRLSSPSASLPPAPTSTVISPSQYPVSSMPHAQHQRSSSVSIAEMAPRSQLSPRMDSRSRSPMPQQGSYYGQPHGQQSSRLGHGHGHAPYPPPQHHLQQRHSSQMEVLSPHPRAINDPSMILQHSSSVGPSSGHGHSQSHVGPGTRYSSSPQLPGSGPMRGSPGPVGFSNGAGSPAHLGHGGGHLASRYSPIPMSSSSTPGLPGLILESLPTPRSCPSFLAVVHPVDARNAPVFEL